MVNVDDVYQRVLTLANKEQRGYITPQEFNLLANLAQKEIFEQYFYDLNQYLRIPGNSEEYSDMVDLLQEKIAIFERVGALAPGGTISGDVYRLGTVILNGREVQEIQQNEFLYINNSPLVKPTASSPVYVRTGENTIQVYPVVTTGVTYTYIQVPSNAAWGYDVVGTDALYNAAKSVDFELHASDESELVNRILTLAGISIQRLDVAQAAIQLEATKQQIEKR
tara:strand:- start:2954 stop:3625 length:672 start_codon:yes stop_codon:yes gene_type:complete